jgi:hypothetical protein
VRDRSIGLRGPAVPLAVVLVAACVTVRAGPDECAPLARQLKMAALDGLWGGVLEDAGKLLECDPRGANAEKAHFYRARALDKLRRREQALDAYGDFLSRYCRQESDAILCEDARVSMFSMARAMVDSGTDSGLEILVGGLKANDIYSRIFAGIQISQLRGREEAKAKALPVLTEAYRLEDDPDFQNEICLAIIRIDPAQCGQGTTTPKPDRPEPTWIRARVFDCLNDREKVNVNLPFSFAKAVIESLGPEIMSEISDAGVDLENLWESLKNMERHQVFEMTIQDEGRCEEYEVWFE